MVSFEEEMGWGIKRLDGRVMGDIKHKSKGPTSSQAIK
jgi:hypothetical protein